MKIKNARKIGQKKVYNLEVDHPSHNYIIKSGNNRIVSANSHATSYIVITYRSMWLKAHYPYEWWAAVMSHCHSDKLPKFMSAARSEGVKFGNISINSLGSGFSAKGDMIIPGILSIKGVGTNIANKVADKGYFYEDIDEFIEEHGKCKMLIEPLIMLGGLEEIGYEHRKALLRYYEYKYGNVALFKARVRYMFAWSKSDIEKERKRLEGEYQDLYPNRKKIPPKILNWVPEKPVDDPKEIDLEIELTDEDKKLSRKIQITYKEIEKLFKEDFPMEDILKYEKKALGYYWTSPLTLFKHEKENLIDNSKITDVMDCVIEEIDIRQTEKSEFVRLNVTDGIDKARITIWSSDVAGNDPDIFDEGIGIRIRVSYNEKYRSFTMKSGTIIEPLMRI